MQLFLSVGSAVLPARLYASLCNQTRTLVARRESAMQLFLSVGSAVLPARLYASLCNQTRTLVARRECDAGISECWISRVAREILTSLCNQTRTLVARRECDAGISECWISRVARDILSSTQRLVGTNPSTGRRYFLSLSATTSSSWTSAIACPRSYVPSGLGLGIPVLGAARLLVSYSWFPSLPLLRSSGVFRLFSAFLLSSIFFGSD